MPSCWQMARAVRGDDHNSGMLRAVCCVEDPSKVVVVSTAPSVRVTVPEALGLPRDAPRQSWEAEVFTALRRLGFPVVFDTNFAADLTIMEEGTELLHRCVILAGKHEPIRSDEPERGGRGGVVGDVTGRGGGVSVCTTDVHGIMCRITDSLLNPEEAKKHPMPMFTSCCPGTRPRCHASCSAGRDCPYDHDVPSACTAGVSVFHGQTPHRPFPMSHWQ